jgi:hypothetical protein
MHPLQEADPFLSPSWRNERVETLLADPEARISRWDDDDVKIFYKFLARFRRAEARHRGALARPFPDVYQAYVIRTHPDATVRNVIEARILARQSDEEIAKLNRTTPGAVALYHRLFFDVRPNLDARDWVLRSVLGPIAEAGIRYSTDFCQKLFAYFGGPIALNFLLNAGFEDDSPLRNGEDVERYINHRTRSALAKRTIVEAVCGTHINSYNVMGLFQVHAQLLSVEIQRRQVDDAAGKSKDAFNYAELIGELASRLPFSVGRVRAKPARLPDFEVGHVEPRAAELNGELPPPPANLRELTHTAMLPSPASVNGAV